MYFFSKHQLEWSILFKTPVGVVYSFQNTSWSGLFFSKHRLEWSILFKYVIKFEEGSCSHPLFQTYRIFFILSDGAINSFVFQSSNLCTGYIKQMILGSSYYSKQLLLLKELLQASDSLKLLINFTALVAAIYPLKQFICLYHGKSGSQPFFERYCICLTRDPAVIRLQLSAVVCLFSKQVVVIRSVNGRVYFFMLPMCTVLSLIQTSLSGVLSLFQKDNCRHSLLQE